MNKFFAVGMACIFMLLNAGNSYAGLFARGGGGAESRTITSVTPASVFNNTRNNIMLRGRFSKKQGRDRRVMIYQDRLPTPRPVPANAWGSRHVTVTLPAHLAPGRYHIYLERDFGHHGQHQWRAISNKNGFEVKAARMAGQIQGRYHDSICNGRDQSFRIVGGPFQHNGRVTSIRSEIRADRHVSSLHPVIHVISDNTLEALVPPCLAIQRGVQLRLVYPNGMKSNWISIEQLWAR